MTKKQKKILTIALILGLSAALRLINLGYSNYQGDEVKALFLLEPGETVFEFLLS